jgi:hypothetical protein
LKYFKELVIFYLINQGMSATLAESARSFEEALKITNFNKNLVSLSDNEKLLLFNELHEWKKIAKKKKTLTEMNFLDAFSKVFYTR